MFHTTTAHRTASALAAASLLALLLAAPAAARPDPGYGFGPVTTTASPASVDHEGLRPAQRTDPGPVPQNPTSIVRVDDDAVEILQIGAGILAGIALAGAGASLVARRRHHDLTVA